MARERRLVGQQLVGRREPAREEEPEGDIRKDRNGDEDRGDLRPAARPYTADGGTDIAGLTAEGEAGRGGIFGGHRAQVSSRSCRPGEGPGFPRDRKSVVEGKRVSVRLDLGGGADIKKKKITHNNMQS